MLAALLIHSLERVDPSARVYRRPQVLLLDECKAFAGPLAELGMRVHQDEVEASSRGAHARVDAVVAPVRSAERARALHEQLGASTPLWLTGEASAVQAAAPEATRLPFDAGRVAFEILLALCDDPYARSRLTRVDADLPAVLAQLSTRVVNLGFGGAFVALPEQALEGPHALRPGDAVDVEVSVADDRALRTRASVVWTRARDRVALPSGVGVRFVDLTGEARSMLEEAVRAERLRALRTSAASTRAVHAAV
jgi:hypothetical protein